MKCSSRCAAVLITALDHQKPAMLTHLSMLAYGKFSAINDQNLLPASTPKGTLGTRSTVHFSYRKREVQSSTKGAGVMQRYHSTYTRERTQ